MTKALLDRILKLVIASVIVLGIGVSLLTEAMAQEAKPAAPSAPVAEVEKPTADFTVSALSAYIWRGQQQTKDSMVIQPSATVGTRDSPPTLGQPRYQPLLDDGCILLQHLDGDGPDPLLQQGPRVRHGGHGLHLLRV